MKTFKTSLLGSIIALFYAVGFKRFSVKFTLKLGQLQKFNLDPPYGLKHRVQEKNESELEFIILYKYIALPIISTCEDWGELGSRISADSSSTVPSSRNKQASQVGYCDEQWISLTN